MTAAAAVSGAPTPVTYFDSSRVSAAFEKGAILFNQGESYIVHASRREKPGMAEIHTKDADIVYVLDGSATLVTGGTAVKSGGRFDDLHHWIRSNLDRQGAHNLLTNLDVSARVLELRMEISNQISAGIVVREIAQTNARMAELQDRWDTMRDALDCLIQERAAALADEAPGGSSGFIVKLYSKGRPVYRIDLRVLDLIRLLLRMEKRAAQEMGQWRQRGFLQKEAGYDASETDRPDLSRLTDEEMEQLTRLVDKATLPKLDTVAARCRPPCPILDTNVNKCK